MKTKRKEIVVLTGRIKRAAGPHEAECMLQDAITALLRQMPGREEFSDYIARLATRLRTEEKNEKNEKEKMNLKAAAGILNGYLNIIKKVKG